MARMFERVKARCMVIFGGSISKKISLGMLLIAASMILAYMTLSISYSHQVMLQSSVKSSEQDLAFARNNIDNLLSIVESYSVLLVTDETIQRSLSTVRGANAQELSISEIVIRNQINIISGTFSIINAVLLRDIYGNIYDSGVTVLPAQLESLTREGWKTTAPAPYTISVPQQSIRPDVISFTRSIHNYRTGALMGYLTLFVEESSLQDAYYSQTGNERIVYLLDYDGFVISSSDGGLYQQRPLDVGNQTNGFLRQGDDYILLRDYPRLRCFLVGQLKREIIENAIHQMQFFMIMIGAALIALTILLSVSISSKLTRHLSTLAGAIRKVQDGDWNVDIRCESNDEIGLLARNFNTMLAEVRGTTTRLVSEQRAKRKYQLELLNQQINPHFLYNTLDNICAHAELGQPREVVDLVENLASFYRGVLSKGKLIVPMEKELAIASSYLNIMQTRYNHSFSYSLDIPEALRDNTILRLTLQPILENAIFHGFEAHQPGGEIAISALPSEESVRIFIQDNGAGMPAEAVNQLFADTPPKESREGFALKNVYDRIQLYYGPSYGLEFSSEIGRGTTVTVVIPKRSWRET